MSPDSREIPGNRSLFSHAGLIAAAAALLLTGGCRKEERVIEATRDKILLLANGAEPRSTDPHLVQSVGDSNIMRALFEGLVTFHESQDDVAAPGVAERWNPNEDFSVWTFYLRKNAKWSNGDPVTARDFAYAYQRILTPELASPYASMLFLLKGAEAFNKGESDDFSTVGVRVIDDHSLELTLDGSIDDFPEVLKHTTWMPVHQPTIEKYGAMTDRYTLWQRAGNHVGNGAFKLKSWRINHSLVVDRNPYYWDAKEVKLNGIEFIPIPNEYTEERAFRDGQLHVTYILANNMIEWYRENRPEFLRLEPYAGAYFYRCNLTKPPFDNPKLRHALSLAIDRKSIVEQIKLGDETPAHGFTPPFENVYTPPEMVSFDPVEARKLLAEAGFPNGEGFPGFEILINTQESHRSVAESIQAMWKEHLNLTNISINNQEWKVFQQTLHNLDYEMARSGWIGDYVHPMTFLTMWMTEDTNNETGWSNPEFDRLIKEAIRTDDPKERIAKLFTAEEVLLTDMPIIPIYWYTRVYLIRPEVKNWNPKVLDNRPFKKIDLELQNPDTATGN